MSSKLAEKYGPVVCLKVRKILPFYLPGFTHFLKVPWPSTFFVTVIFLVSDIVSCTDLALSKEILSSSSGWLDRIYENNCFSKSSFGKPNGLLAGGGNYFKSAHKLALKLLNQFEFFKPSRMEGLVAFEAAEFEAELCKRISGASDAVRQGNHTWLTLCPHKMFERYTLNVIWQIVSSSRFEKDDPLLTEMMKMQNRANQSFNYPNSILEVFPGLQHTPAAAWTYIGPMIEVSDFYYRIFRVIFACNSVELQFKLHFLE